MTKPNGAWTYAEAGDQPFLTANNSRMYAIKLTNIRRGGRVRGGTATFRRLNALMLAIEKRHAGAVQTPPHVTPVQVRTRVAGPVILTIWPLKFVSTAPGKRQ